MLQYLIKFSLYSLLPRCNCLRLRVRTTLDIQSDLETGPFVARLRVQENCPICDQKGYPETDTIRKPSGLYGGHCRQRLPTRTQRDSQCRREGKTVWNRLRTRNIKTDYIFQQND